MLPHILPQLVNLPLKYVYMFRVCSNLWYTYIGMLFTYVFGFAISAFNAHALAALAEVAGPGLDFHLGTILPALLSAMSDSDEVCSCTFPCAPNPPKQFVHMLYYLYMPYMLPCG